MPRIAQPETDAIGFRWERSSVVQGRIVVSWHSPAPVVDPQMEARRLLRQSASFAECCPLADVDRLMMVWQSMEITAGSRLLRHEVQLTQG